MSKPSGVLSAVAVVHTLHPKSWEEPYTTAIDRRAVPGRIPVGVMGLAGDVQCDRRHHGGEYAALYAYADEDAEWWAGELGREIAPGLFGENLRTSGLDVTTAEIGEQWEIGAPGEGIRVEVTSPRQPCRTFSDRMGEPRWVKRFTQRNAPGAYLKVLRRGTVATGDGIEVVQRPGHGVTIGHFLGGADPVAMARLLAAADDLGLDLRPGTRSAAWRAVKRAS
jgi:MOSC domain-containing protein YiiM